MAAQRPASTLADLARLAGVSVATVSRALAGSPLVSAATRERVAALAREHGVRPNPTARNLRLGRTGAIGVVLPMGHEAEQSVSDPFFMGLLGPLADAIAARGHDLLLSRTIPDDADWLERMLASGRTDGVILIGQSDQIDAIERAAAAGAPLVGWGAAMPGYAQVTVGSDNRAGGRLAARRLLERGRRRLAFFGNPAMPEFQLRHEGFREAVAAAGAQASLLPAHLTTEAAYAEASAFLAAGPPPDGIVAASDVVAMSALRALEERGLRVPEDVAVVGYDDVPLAQHTRPPLTTIRQDLEAGARLLVDRLFARIAGEPVESALLAPELVVRSSA